MGTRRRGLLPLLAVALVNAWVVAGLDKYIEDTDRFPGWRGELPGGDAAADGPGDTVGFGELGQVSIGQGTQRSSDLRHALCALGLACCFSACLPPLS